MDFDPEASAVLEFGPFQVRPHRRELLVAGQPVELGSRAFDLLKLLVRARGRLVTKDEIVAELWPGVVVDENNIHTQIATLRKALGSYRGVILTQSGRGYRLATGLAAIDVAPERGDRSPSPIAQAQVATNVPTPISDLIGRDAELRDVTDLLAEHRLVTLTGPGGIGKTRLAVEVARRASAEFADGVWLAELAPLSTPDLVGATVAASLALELAQGISSPECVARAVGAKGLLLVLDNCEHVVDAAAAMAEALLRANPRVRVIATSREPLRAEGERVFQVPPLSVPSDDSHAMAGLLQHGAVKLLFNRARAIDPYFSPGDQLAAPAAVICRRLDGIPLAIELAASHVATLSLLEIAARLDDRFGLLTGGRRTALPRHQTLRATLDWSYDLLSAADRVVLRRLAVFAGAFSLEAATTVAASAELPASDVSDCVASLATKSLLTVGFTATSRYQLLETTRAYAYERLVESGEQQQLARRHAEYHKDLFDRAADELATRAAEDWLAIYRRRIDDVRAALDWAFSPDGDASIGVALTIGAVPLWFQLSLLDECRRRTERALASLGSATDRDPRREMQLLAALGASLVHTDGLGQAAASAWTSVLEIAERLGDPAYQLQALHGMWSYRNNRGEFPIALTLAQKFYALAAQSAASRDLLIGDRMIGVVRHYLGDQADARRHLEHMLGCRFAEVHRSNTIRSLIDHQTRAVSTLARVLWLQGFPEQASNTARSAVEQARSSFDHVTAQCYALAQAAIPVSLLVGDLDAAERSVAMLVDLATNNALSVWQARGRCFESMLSIARGSYADGARALRNALGELLDRGSALYYMIFPVAFAEGLGDAGQSSEGLAIIDQALMRSERYQERWCEAELLRIKGMLLLSQDAPAAATVAEDCFHLALASAHRQGALSWELRTATSLASLWHRQGHADRARALLKPIYRRFTEGFATADVRAAKIVIDDLG
jgi:predicted ATPase/DNA-binding winged helix-turn-helix (wHTH) protein